MQLQLTHLPVDPAYLTNRSEAVVASTALSHPACKVPGSQGGGVPQTEAGLKQKLATYKTAFWAALIVIIGVFLLGFSLTDELWSWWPPSQALAGQLGALAVVTGAISIVWDLIGKRALAEEVLAKARIGSDIANAGIERVSMKYLTDVEWEYLFKHTKTLYVTVAYARLRTRARGAIRRPPT